MFVARQNRSKKLNTRLFVILVEDGRVLVGAARQDPARVVRVHVQSKNARDTGGVKA
jgi:hypothetical protein